jgi:hypothetical protein
MNNGRCKGLEPAPSPGTKENDQSDSMSKTIALTKPAHAGVQGSRTPDGSTGGRPPGSLAAVAALVHYRFLKHSPVSEHLAERPRARLW